MSDLIYPGGELELFARAHNWKAYWSSRLQSYFGESVLEVGAGIGSNTLLLHQGTEKRWVCLEPDPQLAATLRRRLSGSPNGAKCEVRTGVIGSLASDDYFDTILYIDVLEHILDDAGEVQQAAGHLRPGGSLIVLSPAHGWLMSPFDHAVGHHRRYTHAMLRRLTPPSLRLHRGFYLDAVGMAASAANRWLLRQSNPTAKQLAFWDRVIVPCSRVLDPILGFRLGKTVVCIWKRYA